MNKPFHLGLDVGGTNLAAAVIDSRFNILSRASIPAGAGRSIEAITDDMAKVSILAVERAGISMEDVAGWGIGMPSCVNARTNLLVHANCFGWHNVPIYDYLRGKLPLDVKIDNDANCAALGEALAGAARGHENALMLTLGTGVGGGIILDGKIYAGADGMGAELGHSKLVFEGERCTCGQKGCLEAYCSATALQRDAARAGFEGDARAVFDAAKSGNPVAEGLVDRYIAYLAAGLSTFITIFRPEIIILGGGVAAAGDRLFVPLREKMCECTFGAEEIGLPPVIPALLGNDAGLVGAAFLF
ncbi:MAG: ROK family protein [Bacteroidales bacterium]|nr:ROK family protein [Bacteroidales bacterium]